ncbi:MAG: DeoR/GlpR family DNA-binding transcription regulator [Oscillibacter sp.]|jgi:DeoR/GlpR family transcriptional regulator of sugar metabolism|nr:DeoR/GlpR family DNA-binding transcription regulator [Oscillibacter sp.]
MKYRRQNEILKLLLLEHSLKTENLASHFNVSIETIRRDINTMEQAGLIKKVYGGISLVSDSMHMTSLETWNVRLAHAHAEKVHIVTRALELIPDNAVIALDIGTTTYELSRLLNAKKNLSIITNSLLISSELARNTSHKIYCIGGLVMPNEVVTSGVFARNFLNNFASIDLFIGSADGITLKSGITEFNEAVIDVKRQLIARADRTVALIDHSKFGKEALFVSWDLRTIDVLVTDSEAPKKELEMIQKLGVEIIVAP